MAHQPEATASGKAVLGLPALAARAQLGDRASLEELLRRLQSPLGEHIRGIVSDDDAAQDALQNALIIISRKLSTVRDTTWTRAWAYRIATREAIRMGTRLRRESVDFTDDITAVPNPADITFDAGLIAELPAKLATLPVGAQIVLRMHYLQSLSQQEVAEALDIPVGTVKSRLAYGLRRLRTTWVR